MKILKTIFTALLALVLTVAFGLFIFSQVFDADQYFPSFAQKASLALGRTVSIGHLGLGLSWRRLSVDAGPVTIADDPAFTKQLFIKIYRVRLYPDWGALIFHQQVRIRQIILESPRIHFIINEQGAINAQAFANHFIDRGRLFSPAFSNNSAGRRPSGSVAGSAMKADGAPVAFENALRMPSIKIEDAAISLIDQNPQNYQDIWMKNINGEFNAGHFIVTGAVIKDFNIVNELLSGILGKFVGGNIDDLFSHQGQLSAPDTQIQRAEAKFHWQDKTVLIDDLLLQTNIFELKASGSVGQGLMVDMQTVLHLNRDVSQGLIHEFDGLRFLQDGSGRVTIEASLEGQAPHLKYKPSKDFRKKSRKALFEEGANILGALLGGH
jgi:AsmA family